MKDDLPLPSLEDLVHTSGTVQVPSQSKWSDLAAKFNMVVSSADPAFVTEHQEAFDSIVEHQGKMGDLLKQALIHTLKEVVPGMGPALVQVLCVFKGLQTGSKEEVSSHWQAHMECLQKLSDMNLKLLMSFEASSILGLDVHKDFEADVMSRLTSLFSICKAMAEWLVFLLLRLSLVQFFISYSYKLRKHITVQYNSNNSNHIFLSLHQ